MSHVRFRDNEDEVRSEDEASVENDIYSEHESLDLDDVADNEAADHSILRQILSKTFTLVYSPDSYDVVGDEYNFNGLNIKEILQNTDLTREEVEHCIFEYRHNLLVQLSTFFGFPNLCDIREGNFFGWSQIYNNLLGLQNDKTPGRQQINEWTALSYTLWKNLAFVALKTAQNILKLLTEFLPLLISVAFDYLAFHAEHSNSPELYGFAKVGSYLFKPVFLVGRTITSPITSVRAAWFTGLSVNDLFSEEFKDEYPASNLIGYAAAILFAALSISVTTAVYALLLFPLLVAAAPASIVPITAKVSSLLAPHVSSVLSFIGTNIMMPILLKLGIILSPLISPTLAGLTVVAGALTGIGLTTIGTGISKLADMFREWWRTSYEAPYVRVDIHAVEEDVRDDAHEINQPSCLDQFRNLFTHLNVSDDEIRDDDDIRDEDSYVPPPITTGEGADNEEDNEESISYCDRIMKKFGL